MDDKQILLKKVERNALIIAELKNSIAWKYVLEDFADVKIRIDESWAFVPATDSEKLQELRVSRLAIGQIIGLLDNYQHDMKHASEMLEKLNSDSESNYGEEK